MRRLDTLSKHFGMQTNDSFGVCTEYHSVVDDVSAGAYMWIPYMYSLIGSISTYNTCIQSKQVIDQYITIKNLKLTISHSFRTSW